MAEVGGAEKVLPLLQSLNRFTVQHDYLHESSMHRNDAIYATKYGCLLQAFQVHLEQNRINGNPPKRNAQAHKELLGLVEEAMRRFIYAQFLNAGVLEFFSHKSGEANVIT